MRWPDVLVHVDVLRIILQHGARPAVQQRQRGVYDARLEVRIVSLAEWMTKLEWHEQRARRFDFLGVFADQANGGRHQTVLFEDAREHTDGVRAKRSSTSQKNDLHAVCSELRSS